MNKIHKHGLINTLRDKYKQKHTFLKHNYHTLVIE